MIAKVARIFQRRDPQREATLALARIRTLSDMNSLPWSTGVCEERRSRGEIHTSLGAWLAPVRNGEDPQDVCLDGLQQAVCTDLRSEGLGILSPAPVEGPRFVVAVPNGNDADDDWKFFLASFCHQTPRPGGWFALGLHVERVYEPTSGQIMQFRQLTEARSESREELAVV